MGAPSAQLPRSKVKRRASAYTGGVSSDHTERDGDVPGQQLAQLSGLPMDAVVHVGPGCTQEGQQGPQHKSDSPDAAHCFIISAILRPKGTYLRSQVRRRAVCGVIDEKEPRCFHKNQKNVTKPCPRIDSVQPQTRHVRAAPNVSAAPAELFPVAGVCDKSAWFATAEYVGPETGP